MALLAKALLGTAFVIQAVFTDDVTWTQATQPL
jgi:hypothetical protein